MGGAKLKLAAELVAALERRAMARQIPVDQLLEEIVRAWLAAQEPPKQDPRPDFDEFDSVDFILGLLEREEPS